VVIYAIEKRERAANTFGSEQLARGDNPRA